MPPGALPVNVAVEVRGEVPRILQGETSLVSLPGRERLLLLRALLQQMRLVHPLLGTMALQV